MKSEINYAGIDLRQAICPIEIQDECGQVLSQTVVKTEAETLRSFFHGIGGSAHGYMQQSVIRYEWLVNHKTSITPRKLTIRLPFHSIPS